MDETTNTSLRARTGTDDTAHVSDQPTLPLLMGADDGLPAYDDGVDEPIAYSLTARARRQVAPDDLPALRVVDNPPPGVEQDPDGGLDRPGDTRPSRARALRRAGVDVAAIARQLGVDDLVVRAWVGDVPVTHVRSRRSAAGRRGSDGRDHSAPPPDAGAAGTEQRRSPFRLARAAGHEEGRRRLTDAAFAAGLGLVTGIVSVDEHAATLTTARIDVAAAAMRWLVDHAGLDPRQVRVVLRLAPDVAGDLARRRWAAALGLRPERVLHTRWRGAPAGDAAEALVRIPDVALAARLAGWHDALLAASIGTDAEDTAF